MHNIDLSLEEMTKIEGNASLDIKIENGVVTKAEFGISEYKRFYTTAMQGKPLVALPQLLSRICGTCSNAHLLASIEACENALGIKPSEQSMMLKKLTMYGLNIRDHALHLYLFVMPDLYGKDAFLELDENDPEQHQHLHDAFQIKAAGNNLANIIAGRSVHALYPTIGGFNKFPTKDEVTKSIEELEKARPAVLRLIKTFQDCEWKMDRNTHYMALVPEDIFGFMEGVIVTDYGDRIEERDFREHLEHVVIPYSQASGYKYKEGSYMVGSLARLNLAKDKLHERTKETLKETSTLELYPSTNIHHNNLAQAIEILHCLDHAIDLLTNKEIVQEDVIKGEKKAGIGIGVVEAPRGTLYHKVEIDDKGIVVKGEVIVPTGQNQINIEEDIVHLLNKLMPEDLTKDELQYELEKLIRSYDPCMSCATHFLKVNWNETD